MAASGASRIAASENNFTGIYNEKRSRSLSAMERNNCYAGWRSYAGAPGWICVLATADAGARCAGVIDTGNEAYTVCLTSIDHLSALKQGRQVYLIAAT